MVMKYGKYTQWNTTKLWGRMKSDNLLQLGWDVKKHSKWSKLEEGQISNQLTYLWNIE